MQRRQVLAGIGLLTTAGCLGGGSDLGTPEDSTSGDSGTATSTSTATETSTATASGPDFVVEVDTDGSWSGSIAQGGSSRSVDGSDEKTFEIQDATIVSATIQKDGSGSGELTVRIRSDGQVVAENSTTSAYGVVTVSSSGSTGGGGSGSDSSGDSPYAVRIEYEGSWSGSVGTGGSQRSVDGSGARTIDIDGDPSVVSATAQKDDDSERELLLQILNDGSVVKESSTTAAYGAVTVSASFF